MKRKHKPQKKIIIKRSKILREISGCGKIRERKEKNTEKNRVLYRNQNKECDSDQKNKYNNMQSQRVRKKEW